MVTWRQINIVVVLQNNIIVSKLWPQSAIGIRIVYVFVCFEKNGVVFLVVLCCVIDEIKNDASIIDFSMSKIWKIVPDN